MDSERFCRSAVNLLMKVSYLFVAASQSLFHPWENTKMSVFVLLTSTQVTPCCWRRARPMLVERDDVKRHVSKVGM